MYWVLASPLLLEFAQVFERVDRRPNHLYQETFYEFRMPLPPRDEQRRIANSLDTETARIDALVEAKGSMKACWWSDGPSSSLPRS